MTLRGTTAVRTLRYAIGLASPGRWHAKRWRAGRAIAGHVVVLATLCLLGCPSDKVDAGAFATDGSATDDTGAQISDIESLDGSQTDAGAVDSQGVSDSGPSDTTEAGDTLQPTDTSLAGDAAQPDASKPDTAVGPVAWATSVHVGAYTSCAVLSTGAMACWGSNEHGEVGNGGAGGTTVTSPSGVLGLTGVTEVAVGGQQACALHTGGKVSCWGDNFYGQLGTGNKHDAHSAPVATKLTVPATHLGGSVYANLVSSTTAVWGWGSNVGDQLLINNFTSSPSPVAIKSDKLSAGVRAVCGGDSFLCALGADQLVRCWGGSPWGEVGHGEVGSSTKPLLPAPVVGLPKVDGLVCGSWHACAWVAGGKAWCWGKNLSGQLGNGGKANVAAATPISGLTGVVAVSAGRQNGCAALSSGEVRCWGSNSSDQLGAGTTKTDSPLPVTIPFAGFAVGVGVGTGHACLLTKAGDVYCWGSNKYGQLGDGSTTVSLQPVHAKPLP